MRAWGRSVAAGLVAAGLAALLLYWRAQPRQAASPPTPAARDPQQVVAANAPGPGPGAAGPSPSAGPPRVASSGSAPEAAQPSGATVLGSVVDALGGPVIGARVQARASVAEPVLVSVSSDERGGFALALPVGPHLIEATAEARGGCRAAGRADGGRPGRAGSAAGPGAAKYRRHGAR